WTRISSTFRPGAELEVSRAVRDAFALSHFQQRQHVLAWDLPPLAPHPQCVDRLQPASLAQLLEHDLATAQLLNDRELAHGTVNHEQIVPAWQERNDHGRH